MLTVPEPPAADPDSVTLLPPTKTICCDCTPVMPAVLPPVEMPTPENSGGRVGAESNIDPPLQPADISPLATIESERASWVFEVDWPVVLPKMYTPSV